MKRLKAIWFWCAAIPASCAGACGTVPPVPTPTEYTCETYCAHATKMECDFAQDTGGGAGCVAVCQNVQDKLVKWDLQCRSTAETCERINTCER
jgi:hypothetical protein